MTRVVMMKGRTRMAWRRLVSPWGEGEKESLVSHPKTIMKDARSQSSRTHAPQARRHAARPPFHGPGRQAGRDGVAMYYDRRRWWWEAECSMQ